MAGRFYRCPKRVSRSANGTCRLKACILGARWSSSRCGGGSNVNRHEARLDGSIRGNHVHPLFIGIRWTFTAAIDGPFHQFRVRVTIRALTHLLDDTFLTSRRAKCGMLDCGRRDKSLGACSMLTELAKQPGWLAWNFQRYPLWSVIFFIATYTVYRMKHYMIVF